MEPKLNIRRGARLPHWTRQGAIYAVTFRLADSLPSAVLESFKFERQDIVRTAKQMGRALTCQEEKRLAKLFSEKVEKCLDQGRGRCWMREAANAKVVADALAFFHAIRYDHLIRDERDLQAQIAYVLANPQKAGLKDWKWVGSL